jgi:HD-GYP domain-containing protein (c-di-GMP phosphodiesterase class II)
MILTPLDDVRPGMVLGVGFHNKEGQTLLGPGVDLTPAFVARLQALGCAAVWIDDPETRDIPYDHLLTENTRLAAAVEIRNAFAAAARETPPLRTASVREIREALETRRFQRAFENDEGVRRLLAQADVMVGELVERSALTGVSSVRTSDTYTFHHGLDVATVAVVLGRLLGHDRATLRKLAVGCMLHDIGKIFFDEAMLARPNLSAEEARRLQDHTVFGYLLLRDSLRVGVLAAHVAYQHHEWQDGTGYPRGLGGPNRLTPGVESQPGLVNPLAEIAALADFQDARCAERPYRSALSPEQMSQVVRERAGTQFNRELADLFLSLFPPFPVGTRVALTEGRSAGHSGVVARLNGSALARPIVRVLADATGRRVAPFEIDLAREEAAIGPLGPVKV